MKSEEFQVSEKRRDVWREELELYEAFRAVCERHGLRYYAEGGTLIGTIRHAGFIPWDDDMDISMPRKDYEAFLKYAEVELDVRYFLQVPRKNDDYFYGHAKIRKNNTTAIRYIQYPEKYIHHQGVFIDVFPLDNIPDNPFFHKLHKIVAVKMMQIMYYAKYYYRLNEHATITKIKHKIGQALLPTNRAIYRFYKLYEWWIRLPDRKKTKMFGTTSLLYYLEEKNSWPVEWYDSFEIMKYENTTIRVPQEYDKILTKTFGDYMMPVIAPSMHGDVFFDLEHDYKDYYTGVRHFTEKDCGL